MGRVLAQNIRQRRIPKTLRKKLRKMIATEVCRTSVFNSEIGWIGIQWNGREIVRLRMGSQTSSGLMRQLGVDRDSIDWQVDKSADLILRFVSGQKTSLVDLPIDETWMTPFQKRVTRECRKIPWGETMTYGQLAARAGSQQASRAVGSVMANNRFPLIVPCHRVVGSQGLGGFTAPHGVDLKKKLLENEGACFPLQSRLF